MTRQLSIITGCSAGATESFVVVPFELVKIKYAPLFLLLHAFSQTDHCRLQDKSLASTYSGPLDVVRQIVRKDGILGLYAGMEATFWRYVDLSCLLRGSTDTARCYHRHLWWNGGYFGSIFQVKTMLPKAEVCCLPLPGIQTKNLNDL
jgi:solute carrier family 25 2-oxodicarboxylate transporter 21